MTVSASGGAPLRFTISSEHVLEVSTAHDEVGFPAVKLGQLGAVQSHLLAFKDAVGEELEVPAEQTMAALTTLRLKANAFASDLLGSVDLFDRLAELCYRALPARPSPTGTDIQVIDVEAPPTAFEPIELLPLLDLHWPTDLRGDQRDIDDAATSFLGFAALIRRVPPTSLAQGGTLQNVPRLAINFIRDGTMPGSGDEFELLRRLRQLDLSVAWPAEDVTNAAAAHDLATSLFRGTRQDGTSVDVHHFACHVFASRGPTQSWSLQVGTDNTAATVTIEDLLLQLRDLRKDAAAKRQSADRPLPLVFMNACGSSTVDPSSAISFPWVALQHGNRAFIGTETRIPDAFAAQFAEYFYRHLLLGSTAGEALHAARWTMLHRHGNPLGLLYTLYGDPDLRIAHPISKEEMHV